MTFASGEFDVKMSPETLSATAAGSGLGRMALAKQYHGALAAGSTGEMIAYLDRAIGSGGYVAMECVQGTLDGRSGSFLLQHSGTMLRGDGKLLGQVVAESGRGELAGLSGTMQIRIEGGKHYYDFDYQLAPVA